MGEMDDRLQVAEVEVEVHAAGLAKPLHFMRSGPIWLGLVCGLRVELPPIESAE